MQSFTRWILLALIPLGFFLTGFFTLGDYGVNTDEPFHFMRGQAYLNYYLTGDKTYDNLEGFNDYIKANANKTASDESVAAAASGETVISEQRFSAYQQPTHTAEALIATDVGHPPLNGILAAATNKVFYQQLGWLGDVESYHLFEILVATLGILLVMWWAYLEFGFVAALFAGLALALHPMYLGESRFNIKDPMETVFFAATLFVVWRAVTLGRERKHEDRVFRWLLGAGLLFGVAFATKFNAVFVLPIVGLWFVTDIVLGIGYIVLSDTSSSRDTKYQIPNTIYRLGAVLRQWTNPGVFWGVLGASIVAAGVVYAAWPNLWGDPVTHLRAVLTFYTQLGTSEQYASQFITDGGWNLYPLLDVLLRAPLVTILLAAIGIAGIVRYWRTPQLATLLLWSVWLIIPILRVSLPDKALYGATRQIMEYLPALALFAGLGASMIVASLSQRFMQHHGKISPNPSLQKRGTPVLPPFAKGDRGGFWSKVKGQRSKVSWFTAPTLLTAALLLCYLPIVVTLTRLHPNPQLFYNSLIGGLKGAHDMNFPFWDNTMNNAYVAGIKWLNANAEPDAHLSAVTALRSSLPPHRLREDIELSNHFFSGPLEEGEYIMEILPIPESSFIPKYINKFLEPVYTYELDGVPLLAVWHNDGKHRIQATDGATHPIDATVSGDGASVTLDFGFVQTFQRLEFFTPPVGESCKALTEGALSISSDGKTYKRLENIPFVAVNRPQFQTHDVPDYLLAGDDYRFVNIGPNAGACLLNPTKVIGWVSG